jgi:hypothetical protein
VTIHEDTHLSYSNNMVNCLIVGPRVSGVSGTEIERVLVPEDTAILYWPFAISGFIRSLYTQQEGIIVQSWRGLRLIAGLCGVILAGLTI